VKQSEKLAKELIHKILETQYVDFKSLQQAKNVSLIFIDENSKLEIDEIYL
jgi:ATP-dependent protease HslVU (ClpYQ) ATPase subunit